ncbi:MAG: type 4a pilus biogenesis protein PilO [Candidatus Omnitrophica bacterium]|nr:type 4a pilus biogenesis protein PilO [Candidatus Omnitrophota bacterium]
MKLPSFKVPAFVGTMAGKAGDFLNKRNPREKMLIIFLAAAVVLSLDIMAVVLPTFSGLVRTLPELRGAKQNLADLREDAKNEGAIHKKWEGSRAALTDGEKAFVAPNEVPALLENLSQLAHGAGLKIMSLNPAEPPKGQAGNAYAPIPIKISAVAGTHEFGRFLATLESGSTFFRVTDIRVSTNFSDEKRHLIELGIEAYRKG